MKTKPWFVRRLTLTTAATLLLVTGLVLPAGAVEADQITLGQRQALEALLTKKASEIYAQRNAAGLHFQRANFSKKFNEVDESTYRVSFTKDIADEGRMRTERYLLTLVKSGSDWKIGEEQLLDTYEKLVREVPGDETFHKFDAFSFDREGLRISVGSGSAVVDILEGAPDQIILSGDGLRYDYAPPIELPYHENQRYEHLKREHPEDFEFRPELVVLDCDRFTCQEFLETAFAGLRDASRDDLQPDLRRFFDKALKDQRELRKDNAFSGFRLPYKPDRRTYGYSIKRQGKDQWLSLYYDNEGPSEVYFTATGYRALFGYPSRETLEAGIAPYDIEQREDYYSKLYELKALKGEVELAVGDAELLKADITYNLQIKRDLQELPFSLYNVGRRPSPKAVERKGAISVNAVQLGDGEDLTWVRRGSSSGWIVFPEELPAGSEIILRMAYQTTGSIYKLNPSYSYVDRGGWLPFVNLTDLIDDFELTVKAPSRYKTMSVGTKVSEKTKGGITTTHWKAQSPVGFPTVIFGDYVEATPKSVARKMDGTEIPVTVHVDKNAMIDWEIREKQLMPIAEQAVNALNIFREIYGVDYPYGKLDLVNDPQFWGAQSPGSIVYIGSGAFRSQATLQEWTGAESTFYVEWTDSMVAHEVGHQWWAWVFGFANSRNYWFIESLAEYSSALFLEIVESDGYRKPEKGRKAYLDHVASWREAILETDLKASVQNANTMWTGDSGFSSYFSLVYCKGPYAFHILRETFGDEKFFAFLKNLGTELSGRQLVTRDLQLVAEQSFGGTMEWFFDQWIRGVGLPEYSFNYAYRQTEDGNFLVEGNVTQRVVQGLKRQELDNVFYRGIVLVTVLGKDKQEYGKRLLIEGAETPFRFSLPVEPLEVSLNKHGEMLAHPTLENRSP